jgi:hypothetical protein
MGASLPYQLIPPELDSDIRAHRTRNTSGSGGSSFGEGLKIPETMQTSKCSFSTRLHLTEHGQSPSE